MTRKLTQKEFEDRVKNAKNGEEYKVLGTYINNRTKLTFKHLVCGKEFEMDGSHFLSNGRRCPHCFKNHKKTTEQFKHEVEAKYKNAYTITGEYINYQTKIKLIHNECGKEFESRPANIMAGYGCPHCNKNLPKTTEQFKHEVDELTKGEYRLLGIYKNNKTKTTFMHNKCCKEFEMRPNDFISGHRCPHCGVLPHSSKGILLIESYLNKNNFSFTKEYSFPDCKYERTLFFDFMVKIKDEIYLIEFDGEQHFKPMKNLGGDEYLAKCQARDTAKNKYCELNKLKLLRISYKDIDNISELLKQFLK